ncbi:MAG: hypothetical protein KC613_22215, partial [Myxococcales bacterium]|nr:hypothetical protein [Myxococcales bacterium]
MGGGDLLKAGRLGALALAVCLPACDGGGGSIRRGDGGAVVVDGGQGETGPDAGEGGEGGQGGQGGGGADQGVAVDACVPRDCLPTDCGPRPDGCGGIIQCDAGCACQGEGCPCEAPEQCTPQPCRAPRCDAGVCAYDPVTCGAEACECKVEPCDDAAPRRCGAGCEAQFCDPSPDGRGDYLNRCVPIAELPCGACGIATSACDAETGAVTCDDLIAVEDAQGRRCEQLVLFVDGAYRGEQRGTRLAPFHDLAAALDLAALADVRFVIIGGSGNVLGPVVLRDGIELRGGYSGHPFFQPSDDRPTVRVEVTEQALAAGQLVALTALGVATGGAVRGLDLAVPDAPASPAGPSDDGQAGVHTVGLLAIGSPALVVEDVAITVGSASDGVPGADAAPVEAELDPVLMDGQPGLNVHARSPGDCEEDRDRVCDRYPNRCAQPCTTNDPIGPVFPGADGAPGAVCPADVDGIRAQTNPGGRGGQRATICEGNAPGERPAWPEREVNRRAGAPGAPGGALDGL